MVDEVILSQEPVDLVLIDCICVIISDQDCENNNSTRKWAAKSSFVPKIARDNTAPCQGSEPPACREAGVWSKVWPQADLKIMHGKSNKPLFCPLPVLFYSSSLPLILGFVHDVIWMKRCGEIKAFSFVSMKLFPEIDYYQSPPIPRLWGVGGVFLLWQDFGYFCIRPSRLKSPRFFSLLRYKHFCSDCLHSSDVYDSGWCIHYLLGLYCNNNHAYDGFYLLNPASLLYLSQRTGPISYGFHNAVLHSSSWHRLTA